MTFDANIWIEQLKQKVLDEFQKRVIFIGFQGSYKRNEATPESDIDMVVILDKVDICDLKAYRKIIDTMPHREKACGFISGKKEIQNWTKSDLFQFLYDTKPLYGNLKDIITEPAKEDIKLAVKTGAQNIYHAACHCFVFDKTPYESLPALFKMTFFILQAEYFLKTGKYVSTKRELLKKLYDDDREILDICLKINDIKNRSVSNEKSEQLFKKLIDWCSNYII